MHHGPAFLRLLVVTLLPQSVVPGCRAWLFGNDGYLPPVSHRISFQSPLHITLNMTLAPDATELARRLVGSVLIVGLNDHGLQVAKELRKDGGCAVSMLGTLIPGVRKLKLLDGNRTLLDRARKELDDRGKDDWHSLDFIHEDPATLSERDPSVLAAPDVIITSDQTSYFEVDLDTCRWQKGHEPFVLSRCSGFSCKVQSVYRHIGEWRRGEWWLTPSRATHKSGLLWREYTSRPPFLDG